MEVGRVQAANLARTPTTPTPPWLTGRPPPSPVLPDTVPPLPRSRRYLWGSRLPPPPALGSAACSPAAAQEAGSAWGGATPGRGRGGEAGPSGSPPVAGSSGRGTEARPRSAERPALSQARPGKL